MCVLVEDDSTQPYSPGETQHFLCLLKSKKKEKNMCYHI